MASNQTQTISLSSYSGLPVLYPETTLPGQSLSPQEIATFRQWYDSRTRAFQADDPYLAANWLKHYNFFLAVCQIAKGKFQQVASFPTTDSNALRSPQIPQANQIGIQDILPEDINRNQTGAGFNLPTTVSNGPRTWDINALVAGTTAYLIGDSVPTYFSTNGTEPYRYILGIMQDGLVEVGGNTPVVDQFYYKTSINGYNQFTEPATYNITDVADKTIYTYNTPGAILLDEVIQSQLSMMPKYAGNSRIAMIGIKVYEYKQYTAFLT